MSKIMIIVGSVRPGRAGLPIAQWVRSEVEALDGVELDFADLAEINLPFMDEPNHPSMRQYTQPHTIAWSERVDAADAFIFVTPEYNHSFSPVLKNAFDYLNQEWWRKAVAGTRGVTGFEPVIATAGLVKTAANVEIPFAGKLIVDGVFTPTEKETATLATTLAELQSLSDVLKPLRN